MASDTKNDAEAENGTGCAGIGCTLVGVGAVGLVVFITVALTISTTYQPFQVIVAPLLLAIPGAFLGFVVRNYPWSSAARKRFGIVGRYMLVFAGISLLTAVGLTLRPGEFSFDEQVPADGGLVGPVTIEKNGMKVEVEVSQEIEEGRGNRYQRWSFVTVELLDENKEYLSSFGGEFWHYAGYDGEYWEEDEEEYEATLRVPSSGTYYLRLQTDSNVDSSELSPIRVALREQVWWGDPMPLQAAGYVAFLLGLIFVMIPTKLSGSARGGLALAGKLEEGAQFEFRDRTWIVRDRAHYNYDGWKAEEWTIHSTDPGVKTPRYIEREYEIGSNWEEWFWSAPVSLDELQCSDDEDTTMTVGEYVSVHETLPDVLRHRGDGFRLDSSGTTHRDGEPISYHTYTGLWDSNGRSVTIEGDPPGDVSAVVTESIRTTEVHLLEDEDEEAVGADQDVDTEDEL